MSKKTMTKSQLREAINGLGPLAPDWLVEALEDFIELQEAHKNLLAIHAEDAYHLDEARAKLAHDCACATQPANEPKQSPFEQIQAVIQKDSEYAWSWHCNIAMSIYDAGLVDHARANHCAAEVMRRLFGVEPVHPLPELKQPTNVIDSMLRRNALIIANARRLIRDKRMSNSKLYAELFGTGMGIAIKRCDEMSLCPESNKTSYSEMINEIDAQVQAQSCATPANDEPCCNACALAHVTSQQLLSVPDEKSELAVNSAYAKGWNDCRAAMLKGEK